MVQESLGVASSTRPVGTRRLEVDRLALLLVWMVATVALTGMLWSGVRQTGGFAVARYVLQFTYAAVLIWSIARRGASPGTGPASPLWPGDSTRARRLAAALLGLVFCVVGLLNLGLFLLMLTVAAVAVLVAWRRSITWSSVAIALGASLFAFATGGLAFWRHGFVPRPTLVFMLVVVPPMLVAGRLVAARTGVGAIRALEGRYGAAVRSFLGGCLLFVPLGLANAADSVRPGVGWATEWWHPLMLPFWSGINEEVVFRAMVVGLCVAWLRLVFRRVPSAAVVVALLFSAVVFGLGHGRTVGNVVFAGLGYGLPMAVLFARRDLEHAIGAHYMVNLIPWVLAWLSL